MEIAKQVQQNEVADHTAALFAMTRPILVSVANSVGVERLRTLNLTHAEIPLLNLRGLWAEGDGDIGNAFEFVVHEAIMGGNEVVLERVHDALKFCRIDATEIGSILFAVEKRRSKQLIDTRIDLITEQSVSMSGKRGRPMKIQRYINQLAAAFYRESAIPANSPQSLKGLWKADLFLGALDSDRWVGTSIKSNPKDVRPVAGLRIAIIPSEFSPTDAVTFDEHRQIVLCPLPYDGSFMALFYDAWRLVKTLIAHEFSDPPEHLLTTSAERYVAGRYKSLRRNTITQALEATELSSQPHLFDENTRTAISVAFGSDVTPETGGIVAPVPTLIV